MAVEFRILGPLDVTVDGIGVDIVGRHHPKALALLLTGDNRVVSADRLIEGLWDDEPPRTAKYQAQNVIGALRRQLGAAGDLIETLGSGYRLAVPPGQFDLARARAAIGRAEDLRRTGRLGDAVTALRDALAEWRGPALAGLSGRAMSTLAGQLEQLRLHAVEERIAVELELGNHEAVVAELSDLVAAQPLREDFHTSYMLALHRGGRTPEALRVYTDFAKRIADELGVDPGRQLRDLHTAILREDPELHVAATMPQPATEPADRPAQLPADPPGFAGRADSLAELDALLERDTRSCVLSGAAGSGKTALAVHWAHRVRDRFPDGQLFMNLRGFDRGEPVTAAEALNRFMRALRTPDVPATVDVDEAASRFRTLMDGKRMLIVLDNAHDAAQVRPLLPPGDSFTIVTSRNRLGGLSALEGSWPVGVGPLSHAEAVDMLAETVGPARLHGDPEATRRLARLCGHLPLALRIAAAHLAMNPDLHVADYAARLEGADLLSDLTIDGDPDASIAGALDLSLKELAAEPARLFRQLGVIPGEDYAEAMIAAVTGHTEPAVRPLLDRLVSAHLLERHLHNRYRLHDLVRRYAARQARETIGAAERESIHSRFIEWHHPQAWIDSPAEDTNILMACEILRDHPKLWRLVAPLNRTINAGHHEQRVRDFIRIALDRAERDGDQEGQFEMTGRLATIQWLDGHGDRCVRLGRRAAAIAQNLGPDAIGRAKSNLSVFLRDNGQITEAVTCALDSLAAIPPDGDPATRARRLLNLCIIHRELGQLDQAFEAVFSIEPVPDPGTGNLNLLRVREFKASLLVDSGRYHDALPIYTDVLAQAGLGSNLRFGCVVRIDRGLVRLRAGDLAGALDDLREGHETAERIGHYKSEIKALCLLAAVRLALSEPERALESVLAAARLARDRAAHAQTDAQIALTFCEVHTRLGNHSQAVTYGTRAVDGYAAVSQLIQHARALASLAEAHRGLGDAATAAEYRRRSAEVLGTIPVLSDDQLSALRDA